MSTQRSVVEVKERRRIVYRPAPEAPPVTSHADYQPCPRSTMALLEIVPASLQPQGPGVVAVDLLGESSQLGIWVIWVDIMLLGAYLAQRISHVGLPLRVLHHEDAVDLLAFARPQGGQAAVVKP